MGKLIVFEGVEGAGKTTQIERTFDWLKTWLPNHISLCKTREPGGTEIGVDLRHLLLLGEDKALHQRTELLLYAADRAQHVEQFLKPQLEQGAIILCDRYTDSTIAYQGYGRGINLELIHQLNQISTLGLTSDLTLWFDLDAEQGLARAKKRGCVDRMEQADLAFHQRVRQGFIDLAAADPQRIVRIEANLPETEVQQQVCQVLQAKFHWGEDDHSSIS